MLVGWRLNQSVRPTQEPGQSTCRLGHVGSLVVTRKMLFAVTNWSDLMSLLLSKHDFSANFHWWCCPVGWVQASLPLGA